MKPSVIVTGLLPTAVQSELARRYALVQVDLRRDGAAALLAAMGTSRALVVIPGDPVDAALIGRLPQHVGLIASYSTGLDHVDCDAAAARGIRVSNTPDVLTDSTADIAMLLILGAVRGAARATALIDSGEWSGWQPSQIFGGDLRGRTLGIFGGGRIGTATARRARPFGLDIVYHSRRAGTDLDTLGARYIADFALFMETADIVSLHAPATAETRRIINADALAWMRRGSFLINTARGDLVDDDAVIAALDEGRLAGIGFDVFNGEPRLDRRYIGRPDAFLLPHIGSATHETRLAMGRCVIESLDRFFASGGD
jgi:lactate dehydrogenase-like 2-hydroxyacid dehydrogenase